MKQLRFLMVLLVIILGLSIGFADPVPAEDQEPVCDPKCGCDGYYVYDEVKKDCVINMPKLMKTIVTKYNSQTDEEILAQNDMARSIYLEGQKLFRGILISVILFMTCAAICVLSACLYCCRINYSDRKLKREVKDLARQMHKKYPTRKEPKPKTTDPKSENCNVIVGQAGVYVV